VTEVEEVVLVSTLDFLFFVVVKLSASDDVHYYEVSVMESDESSLTEESLFSAVLSFD
jgi:hypothetical protein